MRSVAIAFSEDSAESSEKTIIFRGGQDVADSQSAGSKLGLPEAAESVVS